MRANAIGRFLLLASVAALAAAAAAQAAKDDPSGHVCEIEPMRSAIEPIDRARPDIERRQFPGSWRTDHQSGEKVYVGNALVTDAHGSMSVWRTGDRAAIVTGLAVEGMRVAVAPDSAVEIAELRGQPGTVSFVNLRGDVEVYCVADCGAESENAIVDRPSSHFIVRYSKDRVPITEVVTVDGSVRVRNRAGGRSITVATSQRTVVVGADPPTDPQTLDAAQVLGYRRPFELVGGGRAQSQVVDNQALQDMSLPVGDVAVLPKSAAPPFLPPTADRPIDRANEPGGLFEPAFPGLFDGAGLGVEF
jgi:hypothetical protein